MAEKRKVVFWKWQGVFEAFRFDSNQGWVPVPIEEVWDHWEPSSYHMVVQVASCESFENRERGLVLS